MPTWYTTRMNDLLKKPEIKYGLIIGLAVAAYVYAEYLLGFHGKYADFGRYTGYASTLIPVIGLYYAMKKKKAELNNTISFKEAFMTGLIASAIAAAIISGFFYLYNTKINPTWIDKAVDSARKEMVKEKVDPKKIEENIKDLKQIYSPQTQLTAVFVGTFINGMILSLILAAVMARKRKKTDAATQTEEVKEIETTKEIKTEDKS